MFEIYAYGNVDTLTGVFNAIAAIMGGADYFGLIQTVAITGVLVAAFAVAGFISQFGPWGLLERWWPIFLVWGGIIVTLRAIFPQPKRAKRPKGGSPSPIPADSCDPGTDAPQVKP